MLQIPASHPQNLPIWPQTKGGSNLPSVSSSCCSQEGAGSGFCFGSLRGQKRPRGSELSCAVLCCAVQPACAFSCFVLKYPLVSFFTSYSLYPKLCISPLDGVTFLIAGRALLLDASLLLCSVWLCRELHEHTSSFRQAGMNHPAHLQPVHILKCVFSQSG